MKISVGLPFHNNEATLADAVRSVFAQSVDDWELILMDDGSTDGSLRIAQAVRDDRVRVYSDGVNRRLAYRLNQITDLAQGRYVARMDADDLMHPERLAKQAEILDRRPEVDVVTTAAYSLDKTDQIRGLRGGAAPDLTAWGVLKRSPFVHPTMLGRVEWFARNRYDANKHRAEDHELFIRVSRTLSNVHLCEALYFCREERSIQVCKYLASCRDDRDAFRKYGPALVGVRRTLHLCALSLLKGEVHRIAAAFGCEHLFVRRRNEPVIREERLEGMRVIAKILSWGVPGLPTRRASEPAEATA
jgi:glycosyltransferase involved in cell wall biosynthesis